METLVLGCGEAFDDRLPNTSLLVDCGEKLMLDCGYSVPPQIWSTAANADFLDAIYISHGHADHHFGLPAVLTRMWEDGRTKPLILVSQKSVLEQIPAMAEVAYPGIPQRFRFQIEYREAQPGKPLQIGRATLHFAETKHSARNLAVRVESGGRSVCYSGDGDLTDASSKLYSGAELLFHEAYSFEQTPVHAEIHALVAMAQRENVQRLGLVHVQRGLRRKPDRLVDVVQQGGEAVLLPEPLSRYTV